MAWRVAASRRASSAACAPRRLAGRGVALVHSPLAACAGAPAACARRPARLLPARPPVGRRPSPVAVRPAVHRAHSRVAPCRRPPTPPRHLLPSSRRV
ncbi:Os09g0455050 [Oryza sativa Japonica Group]|uniref:Os09g0455050 protein n=1 Tax=Oryza sativa subsp. japonica TaxID=39947 RepID=A0A0P0XP80_ORYSJ|nr:Os09g0455050 [Oryza sativa Japonica Group]